MRPAFILTLIHLVNGQSFLDYGGYSDAPLVGLFCHATSISPHTPWKMLLRVRFASLKLEGTPTYDPYADDHGKSPEPPPEEVEPTPEISDKFLKPHIQLQKGNIESKGRVIERVRDSDGNELGREHHNPILDTHRYRIRFDDDDVPSFLPM